MTMSQPTAVPLATTLDEATLRDTFPGAPASLDVPRDVKALYSARMRAVGGERRTFYMALLAVALLGGATLALAGLTFLGLGLVGAAIVAGIVVAVVQYGRAGDDFFGAYATARGLSHSEGAHVAAQVPLFSRGDKRKWPRVLGGSIAGHDSVLGHFTFTEVTTDSEGNRSETDYDYTFVKFTLPSEVASRFAGVYLSPKKFGFGKLQDTLAHDRKVELESAEFAKRYTLRVVDGQVDIALYELFSTTFVHRLATEQRITWEQRGQDLVVWAKGHECEAADLDRLCVGATQVLQRYLEERR